MIYNVRYGDRSSLPAYERAGCIATPLYSEPCIWTFRETGIQVTTIHGLSKESPAWAKSILYPGYMQLVADIGQHGAVRFLDALHVGSQSVRVKVAEERIGAILGARGALRECLGDHFVEPIWVREGLVAAWDERVKKNEYGFLILVAGVRYAVICAFNSSETLCDQDKL